MNIDLRRCRHVLALDLHRNFARAAESLGLTHRLLADMHREVCKAYGFYFADLNVASRGTVIVGKNGRVAWVQARELKNAMNLDEVIAGIS